MEYIIEADNLYYTYPDGTEALRGLSLAAPKGQKLGVLGANGAGKSTLFFHLNGIFRPQKGNLKFRGTAVKYNHRELYQLRKQVGLVLQDPDTQLFHGDVVQEVAFGPMNLGLPKAEVKERVEKAMEITGVCHLRHKPVHFLSYGQKKLVCLAGVLAMEPEVLVLDEPTAWLDPLQGENVMAILEQLHRQGKTIILSTHDVELAYAWSQYLFLLQHGKVVAEGTPTVIFSQAEKLAELGLKQPRELLFAQAWNSLLDLLTDSLGRSNQS